MDRPQDRHAGGRAEQAQRQAAGARAEGLSTRLGAPALPAGRAGPTRVRVPVKEVKCLTFLPGSIFHCLPCSVLTVFQSTNKYLLALVREPGRGWGWGAPLVRDALARVKGALLVPGVPPGRRVRPEPAVPVPAGSGREGLSRTFPCVCFCWKHLGWCPPGGSVRARLERWHAGHAASSPRVCYLRGAPGFWVAPGGGGQPFVQGLRLPVPSPPQRAPLPT